MLCAGGVSWLLTNEENIKPVRGENQAVVCCTQILEHEVSMLLGPTHRFQDGKYGFRALGVDAVPGNGCGIQGLKLCQITPAN